MRAIGFICLALCLFGFSVLRPPQRRRGVNASKPAWQAGGFSWRWFIDLAAFRERPYLVYCVAIFFNNLTFFIPSYYVQTYATAHGMRTASLAVYLISIMNAATIPGRVLPSLVADRFGAIDTYVAVCGLSSAAIFYWTSVQNAAGNIAFAVLWGFFSGAVVALANVVLTGITPDLTRLGTRIGMASILKGVGSLIGPPISGAIFGATGGYLGVQLFAAFGMMLTSILILSLRLVIARNELRRQRGG
ncbi:MFS transporter, MCT family, solute carrier family 16 (monocarboxylic acid transporters), member 3 [Geosmithia morbida]|uniref:MFS transporter, MCT family, solute carrier family 16 (Monocarboxylic acid transporters), member 3 n=1 Tax=Geosmithia morbida TaxID=1094350 RepID=A0A9P4YQ03_9HYPO|nr:MFS transporter, MCT family, solute carrier family 16 (monocarboxylic acid transporters), member 3 [Geosmithia morbida]KAF4119501.1 MFS transporter, MCT family, solute carrier family 16 (monocarboxylic acid transporters), member 3 [Geosmithia morbida]